MKFIHAVEDLGEELRAASPSATLDEARFTRVAERSLLEAGLHDKFRLEDLVDWVAGAQRVPRSRGVDNFGQPALTVYEANGFYIDVYFWLAPDISIHDHGFCGAFAVLQGESLHITYDFTSDGKSGNVETGRLLPDAFESMRAGDVAPIRPGPELIHQVWHLTRPTVSLVLRTESTHQNVVQRNYFRPGLAVVNSHNSGFRNKMNMLKYLFRTGLDTNEAHIESLLTHGDLSASFYCLLQLERIAPDHEVTQRLRDKLGRTFGRTGQVILESARLQKSLQAISFNNVVDADQRFLAAVLASSSARPRTVELLRTRSGMRDVRTCVHSWLTGLVESIEGSTVTDDLAVDIAAEAATGASYSQIRSSITGSLDNHQAEVFDDYYERLRDLQIFRSLLPGRKPDHV